MKNFDEENMSEKTQSEITLLESQMMLSLAMQSSRMGAWEQDLATDTVNWSEELEEIFGLEKGSFGQTRADYYELIHEDDREQVWFEVQNAIEENRAYSIEFRFYHTDGTVRWMEGRGQAVYSDRGEPIRLYGIGIDITERKKTEQTHLQNQEELERQRRLYDTILSNMPDLTYVFDLDHRFTYANDALLKMWGKTVDEAVGKTCLELGYEPWHAEMHDREIDQVVATKQPIRGEVPFVGVLGRRIYDYIFVPIFGADGEVEAVAGTTRDITDRQILEIELRESEKRFRNMADNSPMMVWVTEVDGTCTYLSQSWYDFTGQTPETGLGYGWISATHPDDQKPIHDIFAAANVKREAFKLEYRLRRKDGTYAWAIDSAQPRFSEAGEFLGYIGSVIDITERKQIEETLRESREYLDRITNIAPITLYIYDLNEARNVWTNHEIFENLGFTPEEVKNFGTNTLSNLLHPDDAEKYTLHYQRLRNLEKGEVAEFEYRMRHRNGSWRWLVSRDMEFAHNQDGTVSQIIGAATDISERKAAEQALKKSEAEFRQLANTVPQIVWVADASGKTSYVNNQWIEFSGLTLEETGQPEILTRIIHPEDRERVFRKWAKAFESGLHYELEARILNHRTGEYSWFLMRSEPSKDELGNVIQWFGTSTDITERKLAEEKLRQSEERFRTLFNSIDEGFCIVEVLFNSDDEPFDYRFVQANPAMERLTGLKDAIGKTARELVPDLEEFWFKTYGKVALTGESVRFENNSEVMDRWFDVYASRVGNSDSHRVAIVFSDITERKRSEDNLRESEERFRNMADNISQFAWMTDETGWIFWYNRRWYDYTGTTLEEMQGWGWKSVHHPAEVERVTQKFKAAIEIGEPWEDTFPLRSKTGEYRWFLSRALPIRNEQGKVVRWFGTNTDITELRQTQEAFSESELRFRGLQQATPDGFMIFESVRDEKGEIIDFKWLYVNPAAERIIGRNEANLIGKNLLEVMPGNRDEGLFNAYVTVVETGELWRKEFQYLHENLDHFFVSTAVKVGDGFAVAFSDITARKRIEAEREDLLNREKSARLEAEAANRAKDEFLSVLSHELRTPLNSILGWTRMMKTGSLDENRSKQAVETIERNARLQNNLIEDLLDVSRIISGKMLIEEEELDFVSVVSLAIETVQSFADAKNIDLKFVSETKSAKTNGDATRLQQIIVNLTNNAIKFTPENGNVNLHLSETQEKLILKISDTGIGISPDFLPYIFDRFRQADSTTRRNHSGLGLGLTIVSHITELHGGKVSAHSEGIGKGATFTLEIPLKPIPLKVAEETEDEQNFPEDLSVNLSLHGKSILLVDDDCDGIFPIQMFLEKHGVEVICANTAHEALEKLDELTFDLLISDIGMPEIDGYNLITKIRTNTTNKTIPAIALTAYASAEDRERALAFGYNQHLAKPVDFERLLDTIVNVINKTEPQ